MLRGRRGERVGQCNIGQPAAGDHVPTGSPKIKGGRRVSTAGDEECRPNACSVGRIGRRLIAVERPSEVGAPTLASTILQS